MIKLVAVDVDDTLINSDLQISEKDIFAVDKARKMGINVALATGRMFTRALPYAKVLQIPKDQIIICYNGAMVRRVNGELIRHTVLSQDIAMKIISYCMKRQWTLNLYCNDKLYVNEIDDNVQYYMKMTGAKAFPVGNLANFAAEKQREISKMLIVGNAQQVQQHIQVVKTEFGSVVQVTHSKSRYIEITHQEATKDKALKSLAATMGLDSSQVMAIGDGDNDLEMIKWAGIGVAVANAGKAVRDAADYVTESNNESGVAAALAKFIF